MAKNKPERFVMDSANAALVAVIGAADVEKQLWNIAFELGENLAKLKLPVICGGRDKGVMQAVASGCKKEQGVCIGLLPELDSKPSPDCTLVVRTELGNHENPAVRFKFENWRSLSRNRVMIQAADFVFAVGGGAGTANELRIAWELEKRVFCFSTPVPEGLSASPFDHPSGRYTSHSSVKEAIEVLKKLLGIKS